MKDTLSMNDARRSAVACNYDDTEDDMPFLLADEEHTISEHCRNKIASGFIKHATAMGSSILRTECN